MAFRGVDFYRIDDLLSDEERLVRDTVRRFVDEKVIPGIDKHFEAATFPSDLIPDMAAMGLFSGLFAGFAMLASIRQGVVNRCRVTPLSRVGLVLGREMLYVLLTGFQAVVVIAFAFAFGLLVPPVNLLFALGLLSLMVLISVAISYCLALLMPNENSLVQLINGISNPLSLLAGAKNFFRSDRHFLDSDAGCVGNGIGDGRRD